MKITRNKFFAFECTLCGIVITGIYGGSYEQQRKTIYPDAF